MRPVFIDLLKANTITCEPRCSGLSVPPDRQKTAWRESLTSLCRFWYLHNLYREGLRWLEQVLELDEEVDPAILCNNQSVQRRGEYVLGNGLL